MVHVNNVVHDFRKTDSQIPAITLNVKKILEATFKSNRVM